MKGRDWGRRGRARWGLLEREGRGRMELFRGCNALVSSERPRKAERAYPRSICSRTSRFPAVTSTPTAEYPRKCRLSFIAILSFSSCGSSKNSSQEANSASQLCSQSGMALGMSTR